MVESSNNDAYFGIAILAYDGYCYSLSVLSENEKLRR